MCEVLFIINFDDRFKKQHSKISVKSYEKEPFPDAINSFFEEKNPKNIYNVLRILKTVFLTQNSMQRYKELSI